MAPSADGADPRCSCAAGSSSRLVLLLPLVVVVVLLLLVVAGHYCCCCCSSWPVGAALEVAPPVGGSCGGVAGRRPP